MKDSHNSYAGILKAISLFGGVKIFQILITIIRSKVVAVLLGPGGMGISGLLQSTADTIRSIVCCGLDVSAVKSISAAKNNYSATVITLRKLIWFTGTVGLLVTLFLAPWLSDMAFGNRDYVTAFRIVSVSLLVGQINVGQTALLQGTFRYKEMAKSSFYGSIIGLMIVLPLYYFWGIKSIPFVIVISSLIALLFSHYYSKKIPVEKILLSKKEFKKNSKEMLALGLSLSVVGIVNSATAYLLRIFISREGGVEVVGLYNAAFAIANTYIGMVLASMTSDYVPRLSSCNGIKEQICELINKQITILCILILPLASVFMVFIKPTVVLLYSSKFLPIMEMLLWVMLGMFFRGISWAFSYSFVARGDSVVFFLNETATALYTLLFSVLGYKFMGFEGLGIAFVLSYILYSLQLFILCRFRISYSINKDTIKLLLICLMLLVSCFLASRLIKGIVLKYFLGSLITLISTIFAYIEISKKVDVKGMLHSIFIKKVRNE